MHADKFQQLNHTTKEVQMLQKNMGTQIAAIKHEFDNSVRSAGAKTRELVKADHELKKHLGEHTKHLGKLAAQMQVLIRLIQMQASHSIQEKIAVFLSSFDTISSHSGKCRRPIAWWKQSKNQRARSKCKNSERYRSREGPTLSKNR